MAQYEATAIESIERLKSEQEGEIFALRQRFDFSPRKYNRSKKLTQYRALESKHFATKNYDGATYFKYLADELEEFEKLTAAEKEEQKFGRAEQTILRKQASFMSNFLKRIQRDRDEQLLHRQQDSKILIQRNKNMLQDLNSRHVLEYKKTIEFLKYALGNRAQKPSNGKLNSQPSQSVISTSMINANMINNQSRMSQGPSAIKARQRSILQVHSSMSQSSKLPAIPGAQPASAMGGGINSAHAIKGRTKSLIGGQAAANGTSSRLRGNASNLL